MILAILSFLKYSAPSGALRRTHLGYSFAHDPSRGSALLLLACITGTALALYLYRSIKTEPKHASFILDFARGSLTVQSPCYFHLQPCC